jgi:hypothetical protein
VRTDANQNPTAFTTALASQAGLILHQDYEIGDQFQENGLTYYTARLLGDPVELTVKVIDKLGFFTGSMQQRWSYIAIPHWLWLAQTPEKKRSIIGQMYVREGGVAMRSLFPDYGTLTW